ncbi:chemotaxis protein CheY [Vibrio sinaloensis]|uniref:HD domain-containing phosphohydrolase n=1 Tax=Photobacterium sp. (strain ATCC 43367) TaxID=379097 RepID=UPI00057DC358|nr:HD domain-containing phosphohydrolase [Vibrio sinaloensis]KIE19023.1 chemotaxis protein CheY [Vibrio sinaloensis]
MKKVLVVDDDPTNLQVLRQVLRHDFETIFANSGAKCLELASKYKPDIILLDVMMPDMDGYQTCCALKANPQTEKIPVIFVTALSEVGDETRGFDVGAVDYILKPICAPIVIRRVKNHLSLIRAKELEASHREAIFMLGDAGHYNDNDTGVHIWRMASYAKAISKSYGWSSDEQTLIELAAPLHDTGKIGIPDSILKAKRSLTPEEWEIMKTHSEIGARILSKSHSPMFKMAAEIALYHHERWDGTGYPEGLKGAEIPESARIVAVADVFDALTMERPYKSAWPVEKAVEEIQKGAGSHFEPRVVECFMSSLSEILDAKKRWDSE